MTVGGWCEGGCGPGRARVGPAAHPYCTLECGTMRRYNPSHGKRSVMASMGVGREWCGEVKMVGKVEYNGGGGRGVPLQLHLATMAGGLTRPHHFLQSCGTHTVGWGGETWGQKRGDRVRRRGGGAVAGGKGGGGEGREGREGRGGEGKGREGREEREEREGKGGREGKGREGKGEGGGT